MVWCSRRERFNTFIVRANFTANVISLFVFIYFFLSFAMYLYFCFTFIYLIIQDNNVCSAEEKKRSSLNGRERKTEIKSEAIQCNRDKSELLCECVLTENGANRQKYKTKVGRHVNASDRASVFDCSGHFTEYPVWTRARQVRE